MTDDMVVRRMSERTQESYLAAVAGLARYDRRSPDQVTDEDVQAYLLHLIRDRKRAWSTCHSAVYGLRFFSHVTLKRDRTTFSIPAGRQPSTLASPSGAGSGRVEAPGGNRSVPRLPWPCARPIARA